MLVVGWLHDAGFVAWWRGGLFLMRGGGRVEEWTGEDGRHGVEVVDVRFCGVAFTWTFTSFI